MLNSQVVEKFNTKAGIAYEAIKKAIIDGRYQSQDKITISKVARELQITDIPVREALNRLEAEGWVENTPHVGFKVTQPEFGKFSEVFEVRQLLEGAAAAKAAKSISSKALEELKRLLQEMREATQNSDMVLLTQLNYQFHHLIYSSCGNPVLIRLIEHVWAIYPRTRSIYIIFPERAKTAIFEHEEIFQALMARDPRWARRTLLEHKSKSYNLLVNYQETTTGKAIDGITRD